MIAIMMMSMMIVIRMLKIVPTKVVIELTDFPS